MAELIVNTDHAVEVLGVENSDNPGVAITSATVTVSLYNTFGDTLIVDSILDTDIWPLTLPHVSGGDYRKYFPSTLELTPCMQCRAKFTVDAGAGLHREWETLYDVLGGAFDPQILVDNTDHTLTLSGLQEMDGIATPGAYLNAATVQVTLTDLTEANLMGPIAMTYKASSNGVYEINVADGLVVGPGDVVKALITADGGTDRYREWRFILTVQTGT